MYYRITDKKCASLIWNMPGLFLPKTFNYVQSTDGLAVWVVHRVNLMGYLDTLTLTCTDGLG